MREIVPNYFSYFEAMRRVDYELRQSPIEWADLAHELATESQVMVVLNYRPGEWSSFSQPKATYHAVFTRPVLRRLSCFSLSIPFKTCTTPRSTANISSTCTRRSTLTPEASKISGRP